MRITNSNEILFFLKNHNEQLFIKLGLATYESLTHILQVIDETGADIDIKAVMDTWTLQPGYPYVTMTSQDEQIVFTQSPFKGKSPTNNGIGEKTSDIPENNCTTTNETYIVYIVFPFYFPAFPHSLYCPLSSYCLAFLFPLPPPSLSL